MNFIKYLLLILVLLFVPVSYAANGFIVHRFEFKGLQRIDPTTVRNYLPIHEGQKYTTAVGNEIIKDLYKTGFFNDVVLSHRGGALIISFKERPTIGLIQIRGNKAIPTKKLKPVLKDMGIVDGAVYNSATVRQITQGLEQQYGKLGYRAATVTAKVKKEPRNRVAIYIVVHEGTITKVKSIRIIGNHAFSQHELLDQFKLTTSGLLTIFNHRDRYSKYKLNEDLQSLTEFYLNHGYLRFRILSHKAVLTKDHKGVSITIHISEGPLYRIGGYKVTGDTLGKKQELYSLVNLKKGEPFSRQKIIDSNKAIGDYLSNRGYAFARVNALPKVNDDKHMVFLTFSVVPGRHVYVRRIHFFGNNRTNQVVLRREMRQYEASVYSLSKVEESKRRLKLLPYLSDITVSTKPVPDSADEVDLNFHVKEVAAGRASIQGGYSSLYHFLYGASISEPNFMGSGKYVSLGFQNSQFYDHYAFSYSDPYYTINGVSLGVQLYYSKVTPSPKLNLASYLLDGYGLNVVYGFPLSERNSISLGYGFEHTSVSDINSAIAAPSVLDFIAETSQTDSSTSAEYNQFKATAGWTYNGLDKAVFPTNGLYTGVSLEVGVPVVGSSLAYYTASYVAKYFQPLFSGFILRLSTTLAYGDGYGDEDRLPFFKNFYAGGIGSVPAFAPNSLGPKNRYNSNGALGGNLETVFGVHLILPEFVSKKLRTAIVLDAGNVFQVPHFGPDIAVPPLKASPAGELSPTTPQIIQDYTFALRNLRPSLGLEVSWYSPLGPIEVTLAFPLNKREGDQTQAFQFSFGTSF